jgi:hypothetical protein
VPPAMASISTMDAANKARDSFFIAPAKLIGHSHGFYFS